MVDYPRLFADNGIDYVTHSHRHATKGWCNVHCPFCSGSQNYHLGFSLTTYACKCWRCGDHKPHEAISKILNLSNYQAIKLVKEYGGKSKPSNLDIQIRRKVHKMPAGTASMLIPHQEYLVRRGFSPRNLEEKWGLLGTGPFAPLEGIDFKHRIIIPIMWEGERVSFQARDVTDKSQLRYITCPKIRELIPHKRILYGRQQDWGDAGICVEGVTDVWRLGVKSFATFGIKYTQHQVAQMRKHFGRIFIIYDDDADAQSQADKLSYELKFAGIETKVIMVRDGDPGDLSQDDADHLVKQLIPDGVTI